MARKETIRIYRSDVAGAVPSLTAGEIAVNLQDRKLFVGGTNGTATDLQFLHQSQQITVTGVSGIRVGAYPQTLTGAVGISSGNNLKITVAGNRITFAGLLLKAVPGAIQFADSLVDDFQADTNFKLNYAGDLSLDVPASINLGRTFSDSGFLVFGDGTTQSTAYTGEVVESINGCTGAFEITGTVNEVTVSTGINCRQIIIGLPTNVTIPHLSGVGATFTGTVTASRLIGHVDGGVY